jgi:hypothetical protein
LLLESAPCELALPELFGSVRRGNDGRVRGVGLVDERCRTRDDDRFGDLREFQCGGHRGRFVRFDDVSLRDEGFKPLERDLDRVGTRLENRELEGAGRVRRHRPAETLVLTVEIDGGARQSPATLVGDLSGDRAEKRAVCLGERRSKDEGQTRDQYQ